MGWLQTGLVTIAVLTGNAQAAKPAAAAPDPAGVVASCDDFVRVTKVVFTGRTGATFSVGPIHDYLGGDTFGPNVLDIGGVDPSAYLQAHCSR